MLSAEKLGQIFKHHCCSKIQQQQRQSSLIPLSGVGYMNQTMS